MDLKIPEELYDRTLDQFAFEFSQLQLISHESTLKSFK